ncbi:MAG TPA: double-stranded RNA binding motif domain-containing protein, partial [Microbacterium sp.]|nr:double-stranded RNA binding motif domain-containing protein [Microbacterium sp.]
ELASQTGATPPVYDVTSTGPDHSRVFTATVTVADFSAEGTGSSKKQAEMAAALLAWRELSARA